MKKKQRRVAEKDRPGDFKTKKEINRDKKRGREIFDRENLEK